MKGVLSRESRLCPLLHYRAERSPAVEDDGGSESREGLHR